MTSFLKAAIGSIAINVELQVVNKTLCLLQISSICIIKLCNP